MPKATKPRITKTIVDKSKPKEREYTVWDGEIAGFGLRIRPASNKYPNGRKSYIFKYRVGGGRKGTQRNPLIGVHGSITAEQARKIAGDWSAKVRAGGDPGGDRLKGREVETVKELWERYLDEHAKPNKGARSVEEDERNAKLHLLPALGKKKAAEVTFSNVDRLHKSMRDKPTGANRVLALCSHMFRMAEKWGIRPQNSNPCREVEKFDETSRERFLSTEELTRLADALNNCNELPQIASAIRLLIFTGCRRGEILTLRWEWIDFDRKCLRLPTSKTGAKIVHLNAPALEILASIPRVEGNPHVIVGRKTGEHLTDMTKAWFRIRKLAKLDGLRLHDLRHSFASAGAAAGLPLQMIGKMLGHAQIQTTERYSHLADDPVKVATERVGSDIAAAMQGKNGDVVKLPKRQR